MFLLILETEEGGEKETLISCLPHTPTPGTEPASWACALPVN